MKIKINKLKEYARIPERAHYNDVGADVFSPAKLVIKPGETVSVPLGFGLCLPDGYMANLYSKSGLAKKGLSCEMPPIDPGYTGEIHCLLTNNNNNSNIEVLPNDKIGQLVISPVIYADFVEDLGKERGAGAFGSTGR